MVSGQTCELESIRSFEVDAAALVDESESQNILLVVEDEVSLLWIVCDGLVQCVAVPSQ